LGTAIIAKEHNAYASLDRARVPCAVSVIPKYGQLHTLFSQAHASPGPLANVLVGQRMTDGRNVFQKKKAEGGKMETSARLKLIHDKLGEFQRFEEEQKEDGPS